MPRESHADPRLRGFGTVLVLSAPYGATAGGMATRIGTPPNALLAAYMNSVDGTGLGASAGGCAATSRRPMCVVAGFQPSISGRS